MTLVGGGQMPQEAAGLEATKRIRQLIVTAPYSV